LEQVALTAAALLQTSR